MTKNIKDTTTSTAVALVTEMSLFKDIDFSKLNSTIEALAENNQLLSGEEKALAVEVISDWTKGVIEKLEKNQMDMNSFLTFFDGQYRNNHYNGRYYAAGIDKARELEIAELTKTMKLYEKYLIAQEVLEDLRMTLPMHPVENVDETKAEHVIRVKDYERESAIIGLDIKREERVSTLAYQAWKKAVNANPDIKTLIKKAKVYTSNIDNMYTECKNKGNLAKLNVTISSATVRASLKELLNFSVEL
jgi:phage anti-repressor protein